MTPNTLDSEHQIIGSMLIDNGAMTAVFDALSPNDFMYETTRQAFVTLAKLKSEGLTIDPVTVSNAMLESGVKDARQFLIECMEITPTAAHIDAHIEIVKKESTKHKILQVIADVQGQLSDMEDPEEVLGYASNALSAMQKDEAQRELVTSGEAMSDFNVYRERFDENPETMYVRTGFDNLDNALGGGMVNSGFYVLAARPGVGKTTMVLNIAENIAKRGEAVLFVSLEMSVNQITAKRISRASGLPYTTVLMGRMDAEQYKRYAQTSGEIARQPITVNRRAGVTVEQIESMARKVKNLRCLIIDYFSLIKPSNTKKTRIEEYTGISNSLKRLANKLNIPVLCLMQINREGAKEKRPRLNHLRETGATEQDIDCGIILHRPYEGTSEASDIPQGEVMDCYIDKNRHGTTGTVRFTFYGATSKLVPIRERNY